ncbi:hypothetical protein [Draconibacterium halophilum]|uniref:DUF4402 domain-containing protein n=1 Tax=Draconibacterium halophilum TaxID=2706887 RepID=A0A6C0RJM2_9BACT|nr:hypothetical protein [Draconibacterium halophilum]QIA09783.1 hypothetical protein G0Q07_19660 [Draconibacterium halophilum]
MKHLAVKAVLVLAFVCMHTLPLMAQWGNGNINVRFSVPEIAILDIEPDIGNVEFSINAASGPGGAPEVVNKSNESIWINYSSAIRENGNTRSIKAEISEGVIPKGISFFIEASSASAFGSKNQGSSAGKVKVASAPRPIITGIGSCFTGDGVNMGHHLKYFLEISDFTQIEAMGDYEFTVLYTITDN